MVNTNSIKERLLNREVAFTAGTLAVSNTVASFGVAHFFGDQFPKPFERLKEFVAKHIVEPHLETLFESRLNRQLHSADVTNRKHEQRLEIPYQGLSRSERIERISRIIVKESMVFLSENLLGLGLQYAFKNVLKAKVNPVKIAIADAGVQLGAMTLTAVPPFSKLTGWTYHKLADILPKVTGMDKKKAKDFARHVTYVGGPGALGFLAGLAVAGERPSHGR